MAIQTLLTDTDQQSLDIFKVAPNDILRNVIELIGKGEDSILVAGSR
jgi:monomeric isocitrate dehydrogenase